MVSVPSTSNTLTFSIFYIVSFCITENSWFSLMLSHLIRFSSSILYTFIYWFGFLRFYLFSIWWRRFQQDVASINWESYWVFSCIASVSSGISSFPFPEQQSFSLPLTTLHESFRGIRLSCLKEALLSSQLMVRLILIDIPIGSPLIPVSFGMILPIRFLYTFCFPKSFLVRFLCCFFCFKGLSVCLLSL